MSVSICYIIASNYLTGRGFVACPASPRAPMVKYIHKNIFLGTIHDSWLSYLGLGALWIILSFKAKGFWYSLHPLFVNKSNTNVLDRYLELEANKYSGWFTNLR